MSENSTPRRSLNKTLCTRYVSQNLQKSLPGLREPWQSYSLDSLEDFTKQAQDWLRDKSNLRTSTIENADYAELLDYFRLLGEWKPKTVPAAVKKTVAVARVRAALADVHLEDKAAHRSGKAVAAKVPTVAVPVRHAVPELLANLLDMAKIASTLAARASWAEIADKYQRGEMTNMRYL